MPNEHIEPRDYEVLISEAAASMDGLDYANSTTRHARIGIRKIFETSSKEVNIFSTRFEATFWRGLWREIHQFLAKPGTSLTLLTICEPNDESKKFINQIGDSYSDKFSSYSLRKDRRSGAEIPNFIIGDEKSSRYEMSDVEARHGFVSATLNFGNSKKARTLNAAFKDLLELPKVAIR